MGLSNGVTGFPCKEAVSGVRFSLGPPELRVLRNGTRSWRRAGDRGFDSLTVSKDEVMDWMEVRILPRAPIWNRSLMVIFWRKPVRHSFVPPYSQLATLKGIFGFSKPRWEATPSVICCMFFAFRVFSLSLFGLVDTVMGAINSARTQFLV